MQISIQHDPTISPNHPAAGFNTYIGQGTDMLNGVSWYPATWIFTDAREPGTSDHVKIVIKNGTITTILPISGNLKN